MRGGLNGLVREGLIEVTLEERFEKGNELGKYLKYLEELYKQRGHPVQKP